MIDKSSLLLLAGFTAGALSASAPVAAQEVIEIARSAQGCHLYIKGKELIAEGCNLNVRDASGGTPCGVSGGSAGQSDACNNTGNVVIGWNEDTPGNLPPAWRTGNHNLILGRENEYSSWGGVVSGYNNMIGGENAAVLSSYSSSAYDDGSAVIGGYTNYVDGRGSVITGGISNRIDQGAGGSTITGGEANSIQGDNAVICGGQSISVSAANQTRVGAVSSGNVAMPRNNGNNTTIAAGAMYGPHTVSFDHYMPCVPNVSLQMFNSPNGQNAPFIGVVTASDPGGFTYYLANPASSSQSAYTASVVYVAACP